MQNAKFLFMLAAFPAMVNAHGFVSAPFCRSYGCNLKASTGCGGVQYEPQSVEGPDGWPASGPADGFIASAGAGTPWQELNEAGANRWGKNSMKPGWNEFEWTFTAAHTTAWFKYYISKNGWNPAEKLSVSTFEAEPFCVVQLNGAKAHTNPKHMCNIPTRSGYHVVLAIWNVGDTAASFYNAIDIEFQGDSQPQPPTTPKPDSTPAPTNPTPAPLVSTPTPANPTPAPVAVPPSNSGDCGSKIKIWGNCHAAPECCGVGLVCNRQSSSYAQCIPDASATCAHTWNDCTSHGKCCSSSDKCQGSQWYKVCKP